jgi:nickel superoxide dismutase
MHTLRSIFQPQRIVSAHCDVPCGIYDPEQARIEAESCYRILEKYHASEDELFRQRCVVVKEARAEEAKHHIDVLWHDYFKPEHLATYPNLHDTCWQASKAASAVKQSTDVAAARKLLDLIDEIEAMWRGTGGLEKTRMNGRPA